MTRIDFTLADEMAKDVKAYCEKNHINLSQVLRHLLWIEVYHEKSLEATSEHQLHERDHILVSTCKDCLKLVKPIQNRHPKYKKFMGE